MLSANNFTISPTWVIDNLLSVGAAIAVFTVGWISAGLVARAIRTHLPNARGIDQTFAPLLAQAARYAILIFTFVISLTQIGVQTTSVLAVLGAAGLAIALALQGTLSNIAAGVMLVWLRPMAIGEYIDGNGVAGTIVEIGLFGTRLRGADGTYVFAPNSQLWNAKIINYSREPNRRLDIKIGIAYDADILAARAVLMKIAGAEARVLTNPAPVVYVETLGDSAVTMLLRCWVPTPEYWNVLFAFNEEAKLAFDQESIEIPYNKLDINLARKSTKTTT